MILSLFIIHFVKDVLWRRYLENDGKSCAKAQRNPFCVRRNISGVKETLSAKSCLTPSEIWDGLRPIQRRELIEMSLSEKEKDSIEIQEANSFVVFRMFDELKPDLKKSINFMLGAVKICRKDESQLR